MLGVVSFPYVSNGSDDYFMTSIYADGKEYDIDDEITFNSEVYEGMIYSSKTEIFEELGEYTGVGMVYTLDCEVTGKNVEEVKCHVVSENKTVKLYNEKLGLARILLWIKKCYKVSMI
jgi:hypothetical protein